MYRSLFMLFLQCKLGVTASCIMHAVHKDKDSWHLVACHSGYIYPEGMTMLTDNHTRVFIHTHTHTHTVQKPKHISLQSDVNGRCLSKSQRLHSALRQITQSLCNIMNNCSDYGSWTYYRTHCIQYSMGSERFITCRLSVIFKYLMFTLGFILISWDIR